MRAETGYPVLIQVPFYDRVVVERRKAKGECPELIKANECLEQFDRSDRGVAEFMRRQIQRLDVPVPDDPQPLGDITNQHGKASSALASDFGIALQTQSDAASTSREPGTDWTSESHRMRERIRNSGR
jgi:hypothetical protein